MRQEIQERLEGTFLVNARELLTHLQNGATLRTRWEYGKRLNKLVLPDKSVVLVQHSNIKALIKAGTLRSIPYSGDNYEYYLPRKE